MRRLSKKPCEIIRIRDIQPEASLMKFASVSDESLLACYESVRWQVAANANMSGRFRLVGAHVRKYAEAIRDEMRRRRLSFTPIEWPRPKNFK
jgi:hypothetical protein